MLKIVKATEPMPIDNVVVTVYAAPSHGKTSLAFTAEKALLLDFDKGSYRAAKRGDAVQVATWADVGGMTAEDLAPYSTIVVDTAGRALDALAQDIIANNPKAGRSDGSLSLQGFGTLKGRFAQWQAFLRSLGKDLVLICHMDEQRNGDETLERIDAQGASKNEIYKSSDAMCRIRLDARDGRYLDFDPHQGGFGKNPASLPKIPFPNPAQVPDTLAKVIAQIKDSINRMTTEQADSVKVTELWQKYVQDAKTLDEFNKLIPVLKEMKNKSITTMVAKAAKDRGYQADKASGLYVSVGDAA
jgi:hypothetical protein